MSGLTNASVATASPSADSHRRAIHCRTKSEKRKYFRNFEGLTANQFSAAYLQGLRPGRKLKASELELSNTDSNRITFASANGATSNRPDTTNGATNGEAGTSSRVGLNGLAGREADFRRTSKYRMVPIEEALRNRASPQKKQPGAGNSLNGVNGVANLVNGNPSKAQNGALTQSAKTKNGTMLAQILVTKTDEERKMDVSMVPKIASFLKSPAGAFIEEENVKILPSDEGFSWSKDNYSELQRTIDVWSFVLSLRVQLYFLDAKWSYLGGFSEEKQNTRRRRTAAWVRESILQLGPTFIKLGQLSSTRSDLFPTEFVEELSKLQDRVPAFSPQKAKYFIRQELGESVDSLFAEFEELPIAAASLGQVHRALLPSGERVVVKVQRPGLKQLFDIDLSNLKVIAEFFQKSETLGGPTRDWIGIYEECALILYQEIDYINEGRNADRFRRDFRNIKWVRVPVRCFSLLSLIVNVAVNIHRHIIVSSTDKITSSASGCTISAHSLACKAYIN